MIFIKTKKGIFCGGFTANSWGASSGSTNDSTAFVFNLIQKYIPNNNDNAIRLCNNGFEFGSRILEVTGDLLNEENRGFCYVGKNRYYDIEGDSEGRSPLTGEKNNFTVAQLEVFKLRLP